jgi:hypothetical protein
MFWVAKWLPWGMAPSTEDFQITEAGLVDSGTRGPRNWRTPGLLNMNQRKRHVHSATTNGQRDVETVKAYSAKNMWIAGSQPMGAPSKSAISHLVCTMFGATLCDIVSTSSVAISHLLLLNSIFRSSSLITSKSRLRSSTSPQIEPSSRYQILNSDLTFLAILREVRLNSNGPRDHLDGFPHPK